VKEAFSALAIGLTLWAFIPYIRSIYRGKTKPHVFSWVIWGSTTFIVFLAQMADGGGLGAWPIGVSGIISMGVAWLAFQQHNNFTISRLDWFLFLIAIAAIPIWYLTQNPLWAVIILTTIDVIGFGFTFKKGYYKPFEESLTFYSIMTVRNGLAILALEHYSTTTVLFPAALALVAIVFIGMVVVRRKLQGKAFNT